MILPFICSQVSQTSEVLRRTILDVLEEFGIGNKVVSITTDNGANYVAAMRPIAKENDPAEADTAVPVEDSDMAMVQPVNLDALLPDNEECSDMPKHYRCR